MKRFLSALLAAMLLSILTGCSSWEDPSMEDPFRELTEYYQSENEEVTLMPVTEFTLPYFSGESLDPFSCPDGIQLTLGTLLYEGLYRLDEQFRPQAVLAESASYDSAAHSYTIQLRQDARFSDGSPVTGNDVMRSLLRAQESIRYAGRLVDVKRIESSGSAVVITLEHGNRHFLSRLDIPILKAGTETDLIPIGSGPYYWAEDEGTPYLAKNSHNSRSAAMPLARIELNACRNVDAASYAFYAREVQLLTCDLTSTIGDNIAGEPVDADTGVLLYLGFNLRQSRLEDAAVRQALSLAIDRSSIVSAYLLGHGKAAQFPISPCDPLYPADSEKECSADAFTAAMEEIGLNSGEHTYTLTLLVNEESSFKTAIAREIAERCSTCDLQITVKAVPWDTYQAALEDGQFDLYLGECKLTADWDLTPFLDGEGGLNYGAWYDPDLGALLSAWLESDESHQESAMNALCKAVQQKAPFLPLCFKSSSVLVNVGVVENLHPTAADPFYHMEDWVIHFDEPAKEQE